MLQNIIPFHNKYLKKRVHVKLTFKHCDLFYFSLIFMKFSPKCRVLCLELKYGRRQLKKGNGRRRRQEGQPAHLYRASWSTVIILLFFPENRFDIKCKISYFIMKIHLYSFDPLKPQFYSVKLGFTGVYINFFISTQKHRLWVLVRTASPRQF